MKNLVAYLGFIALFFACNGNSSSTVGEQAESPQIIQEIQETEAAVITLDSINQEILNSSTELDALLNNLK